MSSVPLCKFYVRLLRIGPEGGGGHRWILVSYWSEVGTLFRSEDRYQVFRDTQDRGQPDGSDSVWDEGRPSSFVGVTGGKKRLRRTRERCDPLRVRFCLCGLYEGQVDPMRRIFCVKLRPPKVVPLQDGRVRGDGTSPIGSPLWQIRRRLFTVFVTHSPDRFFTPDASPCVLQEGLDLWLLRTTVVVSRPSTFSLTFHFNTQTAGFTQWTRLPVLLSKERKTRPNECGKVCVSLLRFGDRIPVIRHREN